MPLKTTVTFSDKIYFRFLKDKGHTITGAQVAYYSLFAGVAMIILSIVQCFLFEMKLRKAGEKNVKMDK